MVALQDVVSSNERIRSALPKGMVAVFVGGTSGVGEYTVKAFAKYAAAPRVYIVGRSQDAADRIMSECEEINADGEYQFIKADISLLKTVDDVCREICSKEMAIHLLFQSQGSMAYNTITSEGLPLAFSLFVHSRARFLFNLLPQLQKATSLRRVVSVGAATCEGAIDLNNMTGQGFHFLKVRDQVASMGTLILEEAARRAPDVSFVHDVPGIVKSGISRDAEGLKMQVIFAVAGFLLAPFLQTPVAECGERHVFLATSAKFLPRKNPRISAGAGMGERLSAARGTDGKPGTGVYSVDNKGESAPSRVETLLAQFRDDGTAQKVIDYLFSDFKRITGTETTAESM